MKSFLTKTFAAIAIVMMAVPAVSFAAPLYSAGETLQPQCAPDAIDCTVSVLAIGNSVGSGTPGSIPFIDLSGALQQDNANLKWDEVNKKLVLSKGLTIGNVTVADSIPRDYDAIYTSYGIQNSLIAGNYLYSANTGSGTFSVVDITDPTSLNEVGSVSVGSAITTLASSGNYFYTADTPGSQLVVINATNPASPVVATTLSTGNYPSRVFVSGSYLYVVSGDPAVEVFNITNPASPALVGTVALASSPSFSAISGNYIYTIGSSGLSVVNVSNPAAPVEVVGGGITGAASQFRIVGNYLYTFDPAGNTSLDIVNITNPASPTVVTDSLDVGNCPSDMSFYGNYLYVTHCNQGAVNIVDISNPASASVVGTFDDTGRAYSTTVFGSYMITSESYNSADVLKIWSLTDPENPEILATKPITGDYYLSKAMVNGQYAYITTDDDDRLYSIDLTELSDIYNPNDVVALQVDGTIQSTLLAGGGVTALYADNNGNIIPSYSDQSLKKDVKNLNDSMAKVRALQGHSFNWIDTNRFGAQREIGFIAQEVELVVPEVVRQVGGYKTVNYQYLTALQNEALKELDIRLATIETVAGLSEETTSNTLLGRFVDFLMSAADKVIGGVVTFTGRTVHRELCVQDDEGMTCITRAQLKAALGGTDEAVVTPAPAAPVETPTDIAPTTDFVVGPSPVVETPVPAELPPEAALVSSQQEHVTPTASGTAH